MQVESLPAEPHSKGPKKAAKTMFSSVSSVLHSCPTLCNPMDGSTPWTETSLSVTNSRSLLKLMSIELVMASNHLILCHPLLSPSIFPSIRVFTNKTVLHVRWPKNWSFSFSISPSNEYSRLISFRMHWLDLLTVHGTLKTLLQHHRLKVSSLRCSASFIVQFSHPPVTTGKPLFWLDRPLLAK